MSRRAASKSNLFLTELMIGILFFAVTSAVCVQLFAKARTIAVESGDLSAAVVRAQSAAECVKASGSDRGMLESLSGAREAEDGVFRIFYDKDWNPCESAHDSLYILAIDLTEEGGMLTGAVTVQKGGDELYRLTVKKYFVTES